jgi:phosphonate transport system substrate-binding protein
MVQVKSQGDMRVVAAIDVASLIIQVLLGDRFNRRKNASTEPVYNKTNKVVNSQGGVFQMLAMTLRRGVSAACGAMAAFVLMASTPASAEECPRGDLDKRFCDRDGDLTADTPTDPSKQIDPSTLIFAYTPVEDPAVYKEVWAGFIDHMEKVTGKNVQFFPVQSNAAQIEAMRSGRLHVSGFNTGSNPLAVNCAGFRSFTIMASLDGSFGYEMEIITYPGSGIEKVEDIKGKTLAFTSPTSNSGFKAPSAILKADFDMEKDRDFTPAFSGKHDNSILGVANKDYPAASIANSVKARMLSRGVVKDDQLKTIYKSQTFPTTGFGMVYNLKPDLQEKIKKAFFSFPWTNADGSPSALKDEFKRSKDEQFIPITYKSHWDVIRKIDKANGVSYACK